MGVLDRLSIMPVIGVCMILLVHGICEGAEIKDFDEDEAKKLIERFLEKHKYEVADIEAEQERNQAIEKILQALDPGNNTGVYSLETRIKAYLIYYNIATKEELEGVDMDINTLKILNIMLTIDPDGLSLIFKNLKVKNERSKIAFRIKAAIPPYFNTTDNLEQIYAKLTGILDDLGARAPRSGDYFKPDLIRAMLVYHGVMTVKKVKKITNPDMRDLLGRALTDPLGFKQGFNKKLKNALIKLGILKGSATNIEFAKAMKKLDIEDLGRALIIYFPEVLNLPADYNLNEQSWKNIAVFLKTINTTFKTRNREKRH